MHNTRRCLMALAALGGLALSLPAAAHPGHMGTGFAAGLLHPLTGLDHLLALLGVGLWSRQQVHAGHGAMGMPAFVAPVFLVLMALGASTGLAPPALETSVAATVLVLGVLAASGGRLAPSVALLLAGGCGFLHGLAHGHELTGLGSGAGFLLTSSLVMAAGAGIGTLAGPATRRLLGAAIGAAGLCLLAGVV